MRQAGLRRESVFLQNARPAGGNIARRRQHREWTRGHTATYRLPRRCRTTCAGQGSCRIGFEAKNAVSWPT
jgi:hypothetical protein